MKRVLIRTLWLLWLLWLSLVQSGIHAALTSVSVVPSSHSAGDVGGVTITFTSGVDVEVGGVVLVAFPTGFQIDPAATVVVQTAGSSTTLSLASVSTTQVSLQVETTKISVSVEFAFSVADVTNPAAQTTGDFTITTYDPSNNELETDAAVPGMTIVSTALSAAAVAPVSLNAGVAGTATVSFTSAVGLPIGSVVKVAFPGDFTVASTTMTSPSNIDGSSVVSMASTSVVAVTIAGTGVAAGSSVSFKLDGVTNPGAKVTGTFLVTTTDSSANVFQASSAISAVTIVSTALSAAAVAPVSLNAGVAGTATVSFTSAVGLPIGSVVKVAFSGDFTVASTTMTSPSNIDGSSVVSMASTSVVAVTIAGTGVAAGSSVSFKLDGVTNPGAKVTGTFLVTTTDSSANVFQASSAISAVTIVSTALSAAAVAPVSLNAGVAGTATVSFTSAVGLPIGSVVKVAFSGDFTVASTTMTSPSNIDGSSVVSMASTSVVAVTIAGTGVAAGSSVSFKLDGVTNPGAKVTGTFLVTTTDSSANVFQASSAISAVTIADTVLVSCTVTGDNVIAGVLSIYDIVFGTSVIVPKGGFVVLVVPSDYVVSGAIFMEDPVLAETWSGLVNGQTINFEAPLAYAAGQHSFQVKYFQNPGESTTGSFTLSTTDANGFLLESASCTGVNIVAGSLTDASLTPQLAHPGIVSRVDIFFTASAGLAKDSLVIVSLPPGDYNAAVAILSVDVATPQGVSATSSWDSTSTSIQIMITSSTAIYQGAAVNLQVTALDMPPSIRGVSTTTATIESWNSMGLRLDQLSQLSLSGVTAVQNLPCSWVTEIPNPGVTSNVLVTFKTNGMVPIGGKVVLTIPTTDFFTSTGNYPSVEFLSPSTVVASATWDDTTGILELVISNDYIPAYSTTVQVKILKFNTPISVRTASRQPASLLTFDSQGIKIDGPGALQLDAITAGYISGSRLWTAVDAVAGVTSDQTITFAINGKMDPGGRFEFTLPDSQWSMESTALATFTTPNLGDVGEIAWNEITRLMTITLTGTGTLPAYSEVTLTVPDVTNPPKEMGVNNAYLTTRAADGSIIDGPGTLSVMTISRGVLTGAMTWISITTVSASMLSDQILSCRLSGALPSDSIILVTLPSSGWRMADSNSVKVSFSKPTSGVAVQSAAWNPTTSEIQIVTSGSLSEGTTIELLVKDMINPFSKTTPDICSVTTMLADKGVVDESKDIAVNEITSSTLPTEGSWVSTIATPGVLSDQTITFTTGGGLEIGSKFCITITDVWTFMASTTAFLTLGSSTQTSPMVYVLDKTTNIVCATTAVRIDQETDVTIALTDVLSPESIRPEQVGALLIQSHLSGDVNVGSVRFNAIAKGALTGPLTWQTLFFHPGPVAGLQTSANLGLKTKGQILAGGQISVVLPSEWVMSPLCKATFIHPPILGTSTCVQNKINILLLDPLNEATTLDILLTGVYNPPNVIPPGSGSSLTIAADGGEIDESNNIATGAITSAVTEITNSGDHLVAVVGVSKMFSFVGFSLAQDDVVKFVDASTTSDANCGESTTGQSDVGGISVKYLSENQDISIKFTQSSPNGQPFAICYKFGENPFKLYPTLSITVKEIVSVTTDVGLADLAVANFVKTWTLSGNGITTGDQIRWIEMDVVESDKYIVAPPDCLDTTTLAKLSPPALGTLTAPDDDYTRAVNPAASVSFAFSVESSGKTFCLCYKFGNEPYVVYPSMKVQVNHLRSIEATSSGSDVIAVVDAPKPFTFFGDGVSLNDRLYFVGKDSVTSCGESTSDSSLQLTHLINDQVQSILFIDKEFITQVNFDATAAGKMVVLCYQFGMEPYQLYSDIQLTIKMITQYTGTLGSPQLAVAEVAEPLTFLGYGLADGDQVRWILRGQEDCESSLATLTQPSTLSLIDTITLDNKNAALFNFTSTQVDYNPVLCYKFGVENFKLYAGISIAIGTIRSKSVLNGAKDVAVVGARKNFTLTGTNLAEGDRVGWTTIIDSTTPCTKLSLLIPNPLNTDNDYISYLTDTNTFGVSIASLSSGKRMYLCYGFGQEPFKLFRDLYADVKSIKNLRALVGSPNVVVAGAIKTFLFDGDGVATGDFAKFVSSHSSDCTNPGITLMNIMKEYDDYDEMAMYLYEIAGSVTTGSFQVNSDDSSVGLARVLCYRFGVEPFAFYQDFNIDVKTIWALQTVDKIAGGQDNVVVVNEPKQMMINGVGMSVNDVLKFVNSTTDSVDTACANLPAQGQSDQQLRVSTDLTVSLPFEYGSKGGTWTLCYKFDDEPFRLYPSVTITVKEITALLDYTFQKVAGLGGVATIGHLKQWEPVGSGIQQGDTVKIVPQTVASSSDCGQDNANIAAGTASMTVETKLIFSGTISAFPASTSDVYHLCYRFQDEPFTLIRDFTLTTYGIVELDRSVVLTSATTIAKVNGFRISDTDQMGWTTSSTSCSTVLGLTDVSGSKASIVFSDSYAQLFMCYSFDRQPFDIFKTVRLSVVKAEIWTPQIVSIIADQANQLIVSGTFGITQGSDQIAWVPSDVVECSTESVAMYANILQTSVASVTKSKTTIPRAGEATYNAKYVAPASGSGVTATDSFSTWKLCYRFGSTPGYLMFGDVFCSVLNVVQVLLIDLEPSSTGAVMKFEFDGVGLQDFDSAKWVDAAVATSDADCNGLPGIGGSKARDVVNSRATFTFVEESSGMALCYKFQGHAFKLYPNIPIRDTTTSAASLGHSTSGGLTTGYEADAAAAASDQFTPSRDIATVSLTLDKDINDIPAGSNAETAFKASFITTLASSLGIDPSRIQITELVSGSVVVKFQLLPSDNAADPSVLEAIQGLQGQLQDASSALFASNAIVVKNVASALSVTMMTPAVSATTSVAIQALGYQPNGLFSFVKSIYSITEKASKLVIPILRLQGAASVVSISVQILTQATTATYNNDYAFPASATFDSSLMLVHLRFEIGATLQTIELNILDDSLKGVHFKTLSLALLAPETTGTALGTTKKTTVRIYDYGDGVSLAKSSFSVATTQSNSQQDPLQGWQVIANGASQLRVDVNGVFAVDDVFGEAEYNQKCDLASPTGVCTYTCEIGGGLSSTIELESDYNVLNLNGDDFVATMNGVSAFPSEEFTVSLWVKTAQTDTGACLFSYALPSVTAPAVPLALCNPSNLQLFINAESDSSGLDTFVNVSDNAWHFLAITWSSEDGRLHVFDNGMLAFDGGPYREGKIIEANGFFVVGSLVLSSETTPPCTVGAEALALSSAASGTSATTLLSATTEDVNCDVVTSSGFKGQIQHVHVWSRVLARSELLGELSWPLRVISNGLVLGWNFDSSFLRLQGRMVNDLSMQGQAQKNLGVFHCVSPSNSSLPLTVASVANTSSTSVSSCLLRGEVPRLDAAFPCGPVFANIWHFAAPTTVTAQLKNAYGGRLQFRLLAPSFNGSPRPRRGQVSIFGLNANGEATQISVSLGSFDLPSATRWTYYSVVLREDFAWITEPDGLSLTGDALQAVLASASALWIRGDIWGYDATGPGQEVVYLNDVVLYAR